MDKNIVYESRTKKILLLIISWGFVIMSAWTGYIWGLLFFGFCAVVVTYPLFDSKKKIIYIGTKEYEEQKSKEYGEILVELGYFSYSDDGFRVQIEAIQNDIKWLNIQAIFAYKLDHYTEDEICLDVFCDNNISFKISEEIAGWYIFIDKMALHLPNIHQNWNCEITQPAFETNLTLLFERENRTLEQVSNIFYSDK